SAPQPFRAIARHAPDHRRVQRLPLRSMESDDRGDSIAARTQRIRLKALAQLNHSLRQMPMWPCGIASLVHCRPIELHVATKQADRHSVRARRFFQTTDWKRTPAHYGRKIRRQRERLWQQE